MTERFGTSNLSTSSASPEPHRLPQLSHTVASSDATNIRTSLTLSPCGKFIFVSGHKWYISGAGDPRTKLHLVMGKSDPKNPSVHKQQSIVIVPADAPGVKVIRPMLVFGYDDAPEGHSEIIYENVKVPVENLVLGWGRGFEVCDSLAVHINVCCPRS